MQEIAFNSEYLRDIGKTLHWPVTSRKHLNDTQDSQLVALVVAVSVPSYSHYSAAPPVRHTHLMIVRLRKFPTAEAEDTDMNSNDYSMQSTPAITPLYRELNTAPWATPGWWWWYRGGTLKDKKRLVIESFPRGVGMQCKSLEKWRPKNIINLIKINVKYANKQTRFSGSLIIPANCCAVSFTVIPLAYLNHRIATLFSLQAAKGAFFGGDKFHLVRLTIRLKNHLLIASSRILIKLISAHATPPPIIMTCWQ